MILQELLSNSKIKLSQEGHHQALWDHQIEKDRHIKNQQMKLLNKSKEKIKVQMDNNNLKVFNSRIDKESRQMVLPNKEVEMHSIWEESENLNACIRFFCFCLTAYLSFIYLILYD